MTEDVKKLLEGEDPFPAPEISLKVEPIGKIVKVYREPKASHKSCYGRGYIGYKSRDQVTELKEGKKKKERIIYDVVYCTCVQPNKKQVNDIQHWTLKHLSDWKKHQVELTTYNTYSENISSN
ncbi:MAG: hypothetical protein ACTSPI_00220 [Candidatus Heimdallarchaeaceae archaeon]